MAKAKIMVSIPDEMVADLDQAAKQEHRSRSEFVREALRLYIQVKKAHSIPGEVPEVRKAIAVQDAIAAADTAGDWDGTYEIRKWRERR
jgi:metal-responsive CopG/Arc/MetJ family transcriptional regulator